MRTSLSKSAPATRPLLITALMPMEEYIAGVLAGRGRQLQVRRSAESDGRRRAHLTRCTSAAGTQLEGFDFCDTTHCQDLRVAGINPHLRKIAESTAGEVLWYDGEPAATYYFANCGGTTEDGQYVLGNNEARAPYLNAALRPILHAQRRYASGAAKSQRELQRALADDGIAIPGKLAVGCGAAAHRQRTRRISAASPAAAPSPCRRWPFAPPSAATSDGTASRATGTTSATPATKSSFMGAALATASACARSAPRSWARRATSYREILAFYYPGTRLGVSAQGIAWQQLANEDIELLTTRPDRDRAAAAAGDALHARVRREHRTCLSASAAAEDVRDRGGVSQLHRRARMGGRLNPRPHHPDAAAGHVARGGHAGEHAASRVAAHADRIVRAPGTPLWFREGLVLYFAGHNVPVSNSVRFESVTSLEKALRAPASEEELRRAYAEARARVEQLAQQHGNGTLLEWLQNGLPQQLAADWASQPAGSH